MKDEQKTSDLFEELAQLRNRVADLEVQLASCQQAEAVHRQINDSLPVLVASAGVDGYYKEVNSAFERILGWSEQESLSRPFMEFIHPDDQAAAVETFERLKSGEPAIEFVDRNTCKDGSHRWISWMVIPVPSRDVVFGIGLDITKRKHAESALLESERRLSTLMSNLPGMAYRCQNDPNWTMKFVSEGALQLTGYGASDLIENRKATYGDLIHPPDREAVWDQVQQAIVAQCPFNLEYRIHTAAGEERWVWEQGCGVYSEDGELQALEGFITNITPRKHAELELQKAHVELEQRVEERTAELTKTNEELRIFKAFADASGEGFGISDMDDAIVYANPALLRLVGESSPEGVYGKHPSVLYTEDYQSLRETEIHPAVERRGSWQGELTMVSVTGKRIPVLQTSFTLLDDDEEPIRRGVVITDLRDIKAAEVSLQNSLNELQAIYDGMPVGFNIFDMDRLASVRVNPALCAMMGYTEEELKALPVEKAHPPEEFSWIHERAELHAAGNISKSENIPIVRRDGSVFYADLFSNPINYNGRRCIISFFLDISERKESEEELRKSEAKYKALVDSSPDAIVMCDLQGQITFASPQAAERHGVKDASDLVGQSAMDLVVIEDRKLMQRNIRRLFESGIRRNDEYVGLRMDGTTFFGEVSAVVIRDATGEPESFMAVYRDITERRKSQEALQKERNALTRMLQASDHDRELITYEIHDGIAQRLAAAGMYLEAVSQVDRGIAAAASADFDAGLRVLRLASAEARSLMNRTRTPVLNKFGLKAAIADFIDQFTDRPDAPEVTYRCETRFGRLEPVLETTIFRVAQEAISNACIHSKSEIVRVSLIQDDEDVILRVEDNGTGLDVAHGKTDRFGLDSIRERVRLLGKNLKIESTPGQGTLIEATFRLIHRKDDES